MFYFTCPKFYTITRGPAREIMWDPGPAVPQLHGTQKESCSCHCCPHRSVGPRNPPAALVGPRNPPAPQCQVPAHQHRHTAPPTHVSLQCMQSPYDWSLWHDWRPQAFYIIDYPKGPKGHLTRVKRHTSEFEKNLYSDKSLKSCCSNKDNCRNR